MGYTARYDTDNSYLLFLKFMVLEKTHPYRFCTTNPRFLKPGSGPADHNPAPRYSFRTIRSSGVSYTENGCRGVVPTPVQSVIFRNRYAPITVMAAVKPPMTVRLRTGLICETPVRP